jgi:hypothetical protein
MAIMVGWTAAHLRFDEGVSVRCLCGHERTWTRDEMLKVNPRELNVWADRLKCSACGVRVEYAYVAWMSVHRGSG